MWRYAATDGPCRQCDSPPICTRSVPEEEARQDLPKGNGVGLSSGTQYPLQQFMTMYCKLTKNLQYMDSMILDAHVGPYLNRRCL